LRKAVGTPWDEGAAKGTPRPKGPPTDPASTSPVAYALDSAGNATGGVRSPQVDVPIAQLGGVKNSGEGSLGQFCRLFGTTVPMSATDLATRYPKPSAFVSAWNKAADRAVKAGYLLPADAKELKKAAAQAQIGA